MPQQISDPYAVLGIPRDASVQQARQAYRRLAMRYHPDLHQDEPAAGEMRRINEAWHILSSPARRRRYDADIRHPTRKPATAGTWTPAWDTATPRSPVTPQPRDADPGWPIVLVAIAVGWLVLLTIVVGFLPAPLFGLALLALARWTLSRFG
jgi:curved DNA-binding protein CbpA